MPKLKTNRAARKRFKILKSGKIKRKKSFLRHILSTKSPAQKRSLRKATYVTPADEAAVRQLLPYG